MAVIATAASYTARRSVTETLLPTLAYFGAPMMLLEGLIWRFQAEEPSRLSGVLGLFYSVGWLITLIGLFRLNATGRRFGKIVLGIEIVGVVLAVAWAIILAVNPDVDQSALYFQITDTAWPASHAFMLVVGIAAIVAKVLPGWRRFVPLMVGSVIPLTSFLIVLVDPTVGRAFFALGTAAGFAALAYVARPGYSRRQES